MWTEQQKENRGWLALEAFLEIKGEVMYMLSKHVGIKDSNEAEVLAIQKL